MKTMQHQACILWNRQVSGTCYHMGLACPDGINPPQPGQFVMVQINAAGEPLLRRPFSVFGVIGSHEKPEGIELLYKVVGRGTRQLCRLKPEQPVSILGPLGRGFQVDGAQSRFYLAAGGIGVAPIRFLATHLRQLGLDPSNQRVFLGGQTREDLLCAEEFKKLGMPVTLTTDDGSAGDQCLITDPLDMAIEMDPPDMVYACGPHGMLQCVAGIASRRKVDCQLSIETVMACGIGACLGCALEGKSQNDRYLHACMDGPVFFAETLAL